MAFQLLGVHRRFINFLRSLVEAAGAPTYSSSEIGDVDPESVMVTFSENINSPTADYLSGITIKLNAVAEDFETATRQTNHRLVLYENSTDFADANDAITWEYDADLGDLEDDDSNVLEDVSAQSVDNRVGMHLYFNNDEELVNLCLMLV